MADSFRLNLGALRSDMQLTLHTYYASRIWHGRPWTEAQEGIVGLNAFVAFMTRIRRGAEQDDPYSDAWMLRIEEKLDDTKQRLQVLRERIDQVLARVPSALSVGENLNVQPVKLPLFVATPLGFLAVYLLADYDDLARRILLAHHTALIDRHTMKLWLDEGAHLLRSTFALPRRYRYSGACRDDFAANNAVARAAREQFGELPQDVLEGTRRSRFAPPILRRSPLSTGHPPAEPPADDDDSPAQDQTPLRDAAGTDGTLSIDPTDEDEPA